MDDEEKFFPYFRSSQYKFKALLTKIESPITKEDEVFNEHDVSARERVSARRRLLHSVGIACVAVRRGTLDT
jgi:hypothetical protein